MQLSYRPDLSFRYKEHAEQLGRRGDLMDALESLAETQRKLDQAANRAPKPRDRGLTCLLAFDVANNGPEVIAPYSQLVDKVKLMDTLWHDDIELLTKAISQYSAMDIDVAFGGTQFEIALAQDAIPEYAATMRELGVNLVEIEHHADSASLDQLKSEVSQFKEWGFSVVGEVGKKWHWQDATRESRDLISVPKTIDAMNAYLEAGADWIYWEGTVVCALIGRQLENEAGQAQLLEVAHNVDASKLIFEVYDRRGQPIYPILAWLVRQFGPNVNLANIDPLNVKRVEWIRHGITFEMDHPYMRWSADPSVSTNWWEIPDVPDYGVDMQRPYQLKQV